MSATQAVLLLPYTLPITDMTSRCISRKDGNEIDGQAKRTVRVYGRCDGQPFEATVTIVEDGYLLPGSAEDCESDTRWCLEPFLGVLSRSQVVALIEEVTYVAKETY